MTPPFWRTWWEETKVWFHDTYIPAFVTGFYAGLTVGVCLFAFNKVGKLIQLILESYGW